MSRAHGRVRPNRCRARAEVFLEAFAAEAGAGASMETSPPAMSAASWAFSWSFSFRDRASTMLMMLAMELICGMGVLFLVAGTDMEGLPPYQFLVKSDGLVG